MIKRIPFHNKVISYSINGQGPVLVFLHGFCEDRTMWNDFQIPFSENYTIICPDLPGFGDSEVFGILSMEIMADVLSEILENENSENCILVGHSMGGYVAIAFAEKYYEKMLGLCLFHSHPFADTEEKKQNRTKTIDFMERWGSQAFVRELVPKLFSKEFVKENKDFVNSFTAKATQFSKEGLVAATLAMIERPDRSAVLKSLDCPILFIIGEYDEAIPAEFSNAQLQLRAEAKAFILPVAHMGMFEAKDKCTEILLDFLDTVNL